MDPAGLTTSPADLEQTYPKCTGASAPANENVPLVLEILCGNEGSLVGGSITCPGGVPYPSRTHVVMHALPAHLATMPHPCKGVPFNPWCPAPPAPQATSHPAGGPGISAPSDRRSHGERLGDERPQRFLAVAHDRVPVSQQ